MRGLRRTFLLLVTTLGLAAGSVAVTVPASGTTSYPTLTDVRYAQHSGFDRVVFDFIGETPSWTAAYGTLRGEGTGDPIPVAGAVDLVVRFNPARAHDNDGRPTYPIQNTLDPNLPAVRQIKFGGDYEGYVTVGLGLRDRLAYKIYTLTNRVVIDITHPVPFRTASLSGSGTASNVNVTGVRTAKHVAGYDRVVFDVKGTAAPAFVVRYSGDTSLLLVKIYGPGTATYGGTSPMNPGLPAVKRITLGSNSGGALIFRISTDARRGFRVIRLTSPTRLVVDVRH